MALISIIPTICHSGRWSVAGLRRFLLKVSALFGLFVCYEIPVVAYQGAQNPLLASDDLTAFTRAFDSFITDHVAKGHFADLGIGPTPLETANYDNNPLLKLFVEVASVNIYANPQEGLKKAAALATLANQKGSVRYQQLANLIRLYCLGVRSDREKLDDPLLALTENLKEAEDWFVRVMAHVIEAKKHYDGFNDYAAYRDYRRATELIEGSGQESLYLRFYLLQNAEAQDVHVGTPLEELNELIALLDAAEGAGIWGHAIDGLNYLAVQLARQGYKRESIVVAGKAVEFYDGSDKAETVAADQARSIYFQALIKDGQTESALIQARKLLNVEMLSNNARIVMLRELAKQAGRDGDITLADSYLSEARNLSVAYSNDPDSFRLVQIRLAQAAIDHAQGKTAEAAEAYEAALPALMVFYSTLMAEDTNRLSRLFENAYEQEATARLLQASEKRETRQQQLLFLSVILVLALLVVALGLYLRAERIRREDEKKLNDAKSEFVACISHELRTPLNAIIGFSDVLENQNLKQLPAKQANEYLSAISKSGQHLLSIVEDLLNIARLEVGGLHLQESAIALAPMLDDIFAEVSPQASNKSVSLSVDYRGGCPVLTADKRLLRQALANLVRNAVAFNRVGGSVIISVEADKESGTTLQVIDTGIGMSEDDIEVARSKFGQVAKQYNRDHEGIGMGLPIAEAYLKIHGGTMTIESRLGEGTLLTVWLPGSRLISTSSGDLQGSDADWYYDNTDVI